ncbi:hypothetical protein Tsp_09086 [Trichinella spiralis]|uniref:hypothetical protein n=1 Tax=Trichinella spiralis TaxID=6334 RepID=UPI0001EFC963|nr:hypothetical protein Tsp_09086 [Trichinella spiralis]
MAKKAQWRKRTELHLVRSNAETDGNVLYGYPEELKLLVTTGRDVGEASKVSRGLSQSGVDVATEKTELTAREMLAPARHGGTEESDVSSSEVFMSLLKTKQPDPGNGPIADFHGTTDLNSNGYQALKRLAGKCDVKINWICGAVNGYALKGLLYAGRSSEERQIDLASTKVEQLAQPFVKCNRNAFMDRYLTSHSTVQHFLKHDITAIGTVLAHVCRDVLACLRKAARRDPYSTLAVYEHSKKVTMINYVPRNSSNNVLLLT